MNEGQDHWHRHAQKWALIASPLRPSAEDLARAQNWIARLAEDGDGVRRGLILGVTPELALMRWPEGTTVVGVDLSLDMIQRAWPVAQLSRPGLAVNGDWRTMPLADASIDVAIGDGSYQVLDSVADYERVSICLSRVLRPGGHLVLRLYVRPDRKEDPHDVIDTLVAGEVRNFSAFKLRLLMAMAPDGNYGVRLGDVFDLWATRQLDYDRLAALNEIPREVVATLDNYRASSTRYNFPPHGRILDHFSGHFDLAETLTSTSYGLAERCPMVLLARK